MVSIPIEDKEEGIDYRINGEHLEKEKFPILVKEDGFSSINCVKDEHP